MRITVEIDKAGLTTGIQKELDQEIAKGYARAAKGLRPKVAKLVSDTLSASPTWTALAVGGELYEKFCLSGTSFLSSVPAAIAADINVKISGRGMAVELLDNSYQAVLSSETYFTVGTTVIPWMEWLLTAGSVPLLLRAGLARNRNGNVVLERRPDNFAIPSEHAGTAQDNFLTRALTPIEPTIVDLIRTSL